MPGRGFARDFVHFAMPCTRTASGPNVEVVARACRRTDKRERNRWYGLSRWAAGGQKEKFGSKNGLR